MSYPKSRKITRYLLVVLALTLVYLSGGVPIFAGDDDCCTPPDVLLDRNCGIRPCSGSPSGCGCIHNVCDDGSTFQLPPDGCFIVGGHKLCPFGTNVSCHQECLDCGNQRCGPPPCTPLPTCQSSCGTGCPSGASTSSSNPLTGPDCRFSNPHAPCDLGCDMYENCPSTTCYWPETNLANPPRPNDIRLNVGPVRSSLTTNSNLRTLVPTPLAAESATMGISQNTYSGAHSVDYYLRANNMGILSVNPGWANYVDNPLRNEDVRYIGTSFSNIPFNPVLGARAVLYQNAIGELWGHNVTHDRCDSDTKTSPDRYGYYLVNTLPRVTSVSRNYGDPAVTSGVSDGCSSNNYTGQEANNPVGFTLSFNDFNHSEYNDVEALYVWFTNNTTGAGNPPTISSVTDSGTVGRSANDSFGFMVRKEGGTWNSIADAAGRIGNVGGSWGSGSNVYVSTNNGGWSLVETNDGIINGSGNSDMVRIFDVTVTQSGDNLTMEFKAEFYNGEGGGTEAASDGVYRIMGGISDHFSFLPVGGNSIRRQPTWDNRGETWRIDLTRPEVVSDTPYITAAQRMAYEVDATDSFSGVRRVLGGTYRTGGGDIVVNGPVNSHQVNDYLGSSVPLLPDPYSVDQLYLVYNTPDFLWSYNSTLNNEVITINIRDNEGGGFRFYGTSFDNACNSSEPDIDSITSFDDIGSPWLITKAGSFYSYGGTDVKVKDFGTSPSPDQYDFQTVGNVRYGFNRSETQLSTEFLSGSTSFINDVIYRTPSNSTNFFQLLNYMEENNQDSYWYSYLLEQYQRMKLKSVAGTYGEIADQQFIQDNIDGVEDLNMGAMGSAESFVVLADSDLTLGSGMVCDTKGLFMVNGNLTINPNIVIEDPSSPGSSTIDQGCLFIVSGNIIITGGERVSTAPPYPKYDLLEGIFLADNQINIQEADLDDTLPARDGLKIHGSIYGFGSTDSPGIITQRSLKLVDNTQFPAEAVHYDPRYLELVKFFFGGIHYTYKRETGWKPL